jgi:AcrR family transcriptional regulator
VLEAALRLFAEQGIDATSMDAIAEASGVSKATIYKHWPDKDALCLEVMAHGREVPRDVDSGDLRADLVAALGQPPAPVNEMRLRMMPHLMAHAVRNPSFRKVWQSGILEPPRATLTRVLLRGVRRGELPRGLDLDVALALLLGPMMYGHILTRVGGTPPAGLAEGVVDAFLRSQGFAVPRPRVPAGRRRPS